MPVEAKISFASQALGQITADCILDWSSIIQLGHMF